MGILMTNKRLTPSIAAVLAIAGVMSTVAAANHDDAEHLREQVVTLTQQRDTARTDMAGQVEINADYADQIAALTAERDKALTQADDLRADLKYAKQQLKAKQAPKQAPVPDTIPSGLRTWHGFTVGEVIVCPKDWTVSIDDGDKAGQTWAACM